MSLLALVGIALGVVAYQMLRRPVLRKLAVRDTTRRAGETVLVIAGSLLGTAIITGSFIVGDTLDSSIRVTATTQLGPVDEAIVVPEAERAAEIAERVRSIDDSLIDGVTTMLSAPVSVATVADETLAEPSAQAIELDFETAADFGGDVSATGISGDTPATGEVAITEDIASTLDVAAGDEVSLSLYGSTSTFTVDRVLPRLGLAGFWTGIGTTSPNVFVAPGTISEAASSTDSGASQEGAPPVLPPSTSVLVSNAGGVEEGADLSEEVTAGIEEALASDAAALRVEELKKDRLASAKVQGDQFSEFFLAIGSFAVVAGVLLLVQIFVMLAEERKSQLGMLRAVGMRRGDLVRSFYMQGGIYALASGILGALLGIGVGWAIVKVAAPIFGGFGDFGLELSFAMEPESLVVGFCVGILISLLTVLFTSLRISRINIIRAIRDLPEPKRLEGRLRTLIFGIVISLAGAILFISGYASDGGWFGMLVGPPIAAFGLLPLLGRFLPRRAAVIAVALFSLLWGIFGDQLTGGKMFEEGDIFAFVIQGVLLNISAVVLLSQTQENLEGLMHRFAPRSLALRLGMAYPLARRFRTGLTLGMFSLVVFTMVFISVLSNVFGGQVENLVAREAGAYDIVVDSLGSNPPAAEELAAVEGVDEITSFIYGAARFTAEGQPEPTGWPVAGIGRDFVDAGPPDLEELAPGIESDAAAWKLVASDPTKTIVPVFFLQEGGGGPPQSVAPLGSTISLINPVTGASAEREVIAYSGNDFFFNGAYMAADGVEEIMGDLAVRSRFLIGTDGDNASAERLATELQGQFIANGVEAETFRSRIEDFQAGNLQFFRLMQGYLALGLLVGIAGIGVVMVRAVRERTREVGVLRSLGFLPKTVRRAFILESAFTAFEGILVGTGLALITAYQLVSTGEFGEGIEFAIPWPDISILVIVAVTASLLATAWPAQRASQIPPAVALRVAD